MTSPPPGYHRCARCREWTHEDELDEDPTGRDWCVPCREYAGDLVEGEADETIAELAAGEDQTDERPWWAGEDAA